MKSPMVFDQGLLKEFKIPPTADLDPVFKVSYVRQQLDEFKKVLFRNRVDAIISQDLIDRAQKDNNEALEGKGRENLTGYRNVIKQMASGIEIMEVLLSELESAAKPAE